MATSLAGANDIGPNEKSAGGKGPGGDPTGRDRAASAAVRRRSRMLTIAVVLAVVPVAASWTQRLVDAPVDGWFEGTTTSAVGSDFRIFYTAGVVVESGNSDILYDIPEFRAAVAAATGAQTGADTLFANPPALALLMRPVAGIHWQTAWIAWTVASLGLLFAAGHLLGIRRPWWVVAAAPLTYPGYLAVISGQMTVLWLVAFAAVAWAVRTERLVLAGVLAGILLLKPTLVIGLVTWWLLDRRMRPALGGLGLGAGAVVAASLLISPSGSIAYPWSLRAFAEARADPVAQWAQVSPWGFVGSLTADSPAVGLVVGIAAATVALVFFVKLLRVTSGEPMVRYSAAVVLTLWVAPHLLVYDWLLVIPAVAALWSAGRIDLHQAVAAVAVVMAAAYWTVVIGGFTRDTWGWTVQLSVPVFAAVMMWMFLAAIRRGVQDSGSAMNSRTSE